MKLRSYQIRFIKEIMAHFSSGVQGVIGDMPTGSGKTVCIARISQMVAKDDWNVLIIVHRDELVRQTSSKLKALNVDHGIVASKFVNERPRAKIQVTMIQTIARRLDRIKREFHLIIFDEAHLGAAKSYNKVIAKWQSAYRLGLSATPYRTDKKGLTNIGSVLVKGPRIPFLVKTGSLVPFRTFSPSVADLSGLTIVNGEYDIAAQSAILNRPHVVGKVVDHYILHADGRFALCFGASRNHSKSLCAEFRSRGIKAFHIDGETPPELRSKAIRYLEEGKITVLCNYGCLTEGFDTTIVSAIVIARKTTSPSLFRQMGGRGFRPIDQSYKRIVDVNKIDCIILDHGGNALEHGNFSDDPVYDLKGVVKSKSKTVMCKMCKNCSGIVSISAAECPECGESFLSDRKERKITEKEGELVELTSDLPHLTISRKDLKSGRRQMFKGGVESVESKIDSMLTEFGV